MRVDPSGAAGQIPATPPKRQTPAIDHRTSIRDRNRQTDPPTPPVAPLIVTPSVVAGITKASRTARIGTGDMRREMTRLLADIETLIADPRAARIGAWVVRGEVRKLEVLDSFVGGYIRG